MRKISFYIMSAAFLAYCVFILVLYSGSYHEVPGAALFAGVVFSTLGAKLLFILLLAASAFGAGGTVFRWWLPGFGSLLEEGLVKVSLGLVALSYAVFVVGYAGLLYPAAGYVLLGLGIASGLRDIRRFAGRLAAVPRSVDLTVPAVALIGVSLYFLIKGLYGSLLPPTGFDVLMYHLGVPKMYIDAHGIYPTPDISGSFFPFGVEMLYTLGMLVDDVISANVVNYSFAVMGGLVAAHFTRSFLKGASGLAAFAVYVSIPMVVWLMPQAYIELAQAAYTGLAIYALLAAFRNQDTRWLVVSAVLAGFTMAIKYTGAVLVAVMFAGVLAHYILVDKERAAVSLRRAAVFLGVCLAVSAPWYIKNLAYYGDPVFPFLTLVLGGWKGVAAAGEPAGGAGGALLKYVTSFWRTTLDAGAYGMGWSNGLGPYFLMFIPGALLFRKHERELKYLMVFCLAFYSVMVLSSNIRYLAPILPALAVVAAYPVGRSINGDTRPERALGVALALVFSLGALQVNSHQQSFAGFPSASLRNTDRYYSQGMWSGYLASYDTWAWINRNLPRDAVIYQLWDDASVYFRERETIGFPMSIGRTGRQRMHYILGDNAFGGYLPGEDIIANLKEMGADYLLINANREGRALPEDPYFLANVRLVHSDKGVYLFSLNP